MDRQTLTDPLPPSPFRANIVVQCESWWNLAKQFASRSPPLHLLSSSVQRTLMKALVLGGFAQMDSDAKQQYWAEVTCADTCRSAEVIYLLMTV